MSSSASPRRIVVLISGSGTNLQALIDAQNSPKLPDTQITLVLSNRKAAYGLTRAQQSTPPISTAYLALQPYLKANPGKSRDDYDAEVARIVLRAKPDLVVLAGWMHVFGNGFLDLMYGVKPVDEGSSASTSASRTTSSDSVSESSSLVHGHTHTQIPVINLHPALPGAFDGTNAIERAYEAFQKGEITHSGVMVHKVVKVVDRGEPLVVRRVEFEEGESLDAFAERLHEVEHEVIVEATKKMLDQVKPEPELVAVEA